MRSPMLIAMGLDTYAISALQVLRSAAGYYIGTSDTFLDCPMSRDSGYYSTHEEAYQDLAAFECMTPEVAATYLRIHP
jgi:hypothetical protein